MSFYTLYDQIYLVWNILVLEMLLVKAVISDWIRHETLTKRLSPVELIGARRYAPRRLEKNFVNIPAWDILLDIR